jgi:SOS-response transcriptional repressor LexA
LRLQKPTGCFLHPGEAGAGAVDHSPGPLTRRSAHEAVQLPLFASIPAGLPDGFDGSEADETLRFIPTTLGISNPGKAFAVRVRGDSMIDAGIFSGDIVVLEQKEAKSGDIVAALIDGENTLKRYVSEKGRVYLKAENRDYPNLDPVRRGQRPPDHGRRGLTNPAWPEFSRPSKGE